MAKSKKSTQVTAPSKTKEQRAQDHADLMLLHQEQRRVKEEKKALAAKERVLKAAQLEAERPQREAERKRRMAEKIKDDEERKEKEDMERQIGVHRNNSMAIIQAYCRDESKAHPTDLGRLIKIAQNGTLGRKGLPIYAHATPAFLEAEKEVITWARNESARNEILGLLSNAKYSLTTVLDGESYEEEWANSGYQPLSNTHEPKHQETIATKTSPSPSSSGSVSSSLSSSLGNSMSFMETAGIKGTGVVVDIEEQEGVDGVESSVVKNTAVPSLDAMPGLVSHGPDQPHAAYEGTAKNIFNEDTPTPSKSSGSTGGEKVAGYEEPPLKTGQDVSKAGFGTPKTTSQPKRARDESQSPPNLGGKGGRKFTGPGPITLNSPLPPTSLPKGTTGVTNALKTAHVEDEF